MIQCVEGQGRIRTCPLVVEPWSDQVSRSPTAVSLFASAGFGDLALQKLGFQILAASEIDPQKASMYRRNFPTVQVFEGDIRETSGRLADAALLRLGQSPLDLLVATPPCQTYSANGRDKRRRHGDEAPLLKKITKSHLLFDIIPLIRKLKPRMIILENVLGIRESRSRIDSNSLLEDFELALPEYTGTWRKINFADYGLPQSRRRIIGLFVLTSHLDPEFRVSDSKKELFPDTTHAQYPRAGQGRWVTLRSAIQHLPVLDAGSAIAATSGMPLHYVSVLRPTAYWWVQHTPPGGSAFDNQCVNPGCLFAANPTHGVTLSESGKRMPSRATPIFCAMCKELLPRPSIGSGPHRRVITGYTTSYKRMPYDRPAPTVTGRFAYVSGSSSLHPVQNRPLSVLEAAILQSISDYPYIWEKDDGNAPSQELLREVIGDAVPPLGIEILARHLYKFGLGETKRKPTASGFPA